MADYTPEQYAGRLASWRLGRGPGSLAGAMERAAMDGSATIGGISRGTFMRDDKGGGPRSATDTGALRILSGATAGAVSVAAGSGLNRPGAINAVEIAVGATAVQVTLEKGVDATVAPGAYNEARTARSGRDLSFLRPAAEAARPIIRRRAEALARGSFLQHVGGR